jgi:hypothetical protein
VRSDANRDVRANAASGFRSSKESVSASSGDASSKAGRTHRRLAESRLVESDDPGSRTSPELGETRLVATECDALDSVELEESRRELAAAIRGRRLGPRVLTAEIDVGHAVSRLAHDCLGEPLRDERVGDRGPDQRLDLAAQVDVRMRVGEPVVGGEQDLPFEALELLLELAVDLLERCAWLVARDPERVAELVDGREDGEDDLALLAQRSYRASTRSVGRPGPSGARSGPPPTRDRG